MIQTWALTSTQSHFSNKLPWAFSTGRSDVNSEPERERGRQWCFFVLHHLSFILAFDWPFCLKPSELELHQNQLYRDFFMIVLFYSIHGEQYGRQVHLFRKRKMLFQKFCFPDWRLGGSTTKSERSGSDIPALRPNHNYVPIARWKEGYKSSSKTHGSIIRNCAWASNSVVGLNIKKHCCIYVKGKRKKHSPHNIVWPQTVKLYSLWMSDTGMYSSVCVVYIYYI